jgi:hypothetical protein
MLELALNGNLVEYYTPFFHLKKYVKKIKINRNMFSLMLDLSFKIFYIFICWKGTKIGIV